jgi:hypothetical protein
MTPPHDLTPLPAFGQFLDQARPVARIGRKGRL